MAVPDRAWGPTRLLAHHLDKLILTLLQEGFQLRQRDFLVPILRPPQAQYRLRSPLGGVIEQALVDMTDLLDVESAEAEATRLGRAATRQPHPEDRRMILISLTPSGRTFIGKHLPERYRKAHRIVGCLTTGERKALVRIYSKVLDVLSTEGPEGHK